MTTQPGAGSRLELSSFRVRRVSSQQMMSAAASAATARGDRSPRLPIGVPTSTMRPSARRPARISQPVDLEVVADLQAPALERPGLGHDQRAAPWRGGRHAVAADQVDPRTRAPTGRIINRSKHQATSRRPSAGRVRVWHQRWAAKALSAPST